MKKFKFWLACKMIGLCNKALEFKHYAEDQEEINEVVKAKNFFIKQKEKYSY